jgi:hypothetical protein
VASMDIGTILKADQPAYTRRNGATTSEKNIVDLGASAIGSPTCL